MTKVDVYEAVTNTIKFEVEYDDCESLGNAEPTSRLLNGTSDFWADEEWVEPVKLPDGRTGERYYLFDKETVDTCCDSGNGPEDYPWDLEHCTKIILDE